jgi:hypothetical protein
MERQRPLGRVGHAEAVAMLDQLRQHEITLKRMTFLYTATGPRGSRIGIPEEEFFA